ncbi:MAG: UDP-N-acetylglucosamine 1-carboxyvinyltransferase [Firmicutes bacterium]|nr:UDP-N-acetylglucosamine 1-carboxyvinyltransferase [Bacillota bacterium]MBO2521064.1 UDP-N-acetylglucosamine 1-carboxyvinyltransferase [Bacillota bacterium]
MAVFRIAGGAPLYGHVTVGGSKNSALAILAAAALAEGESVLENIPKHTDVYVMCRILEELGVRVWVDQKGRFHVDGRGLSRYTPSYDLARRIRGSIYTAGLLLARFGRAEVPLPGGCAIGSRGVDFHIKGFQQLGADVSIEHGLIKAETAGLVGTKIYINRASVGATVNMMLAAVLAKGTTVLENAAKEPEVVDLAIFLNAMGAKIRGAGTDVIKIQGVSKLQPAEYSIIPDRLEAGTFMIAVGACGGEVTLHNVVPEHLRTPVIKLKEAGLHIEAGDSELVVRSHKRPVSVDVETAVYPGFPTDLQQPFVAMMSVAEGTSVVRETIFTDRFRYVDELRRMGADIKMEQDTAIVRGVQRLTGAPVEVSDLRAGAALVIAALAADGETRVEGAEVLSRGYERIDQKLAALGARIAVEGEIDSDGLFAELCHPMRVET